MRPGAEGARAPGGSVVHLRSPTGSSGPGFKFHNHHLGRRGCNVPATVPLPFLGHLKRLRSSPWPLTHWPRCREEEKGPQRPHIHSPLPSVWSPMAEKMGKHLKRKKEEVRGEKWRSHTRSHWCMQAKNLETRFELLNNLL